MRLRFLALLFASALGGAAGADEPPAPPDPAAVADLVLDLGAGQSYLRETARERLVALGAAVVPDLVRVLASGNARAKAEAARTLGEIGPTARDAIPALEKLAASADATLASAAKDALAVLDPTRFRGDAPTKEPTLPDLLRGLASKDSAARREAIRGLGEVRGDDAPRAATALAGVLADKSSATRIAALRALASLGPAASAEAPRVVDCLDDAERDVRSAGLLALARSGASGVAPALHRIARIHEAQDDPRDAHPWLLAAIRNAGPGAASEARAALCGDEVFLAAAGADALGVVPSLDAEGVASLVAALSGRPALVRRRAAHALGEIGAAVPDAAVESLVAVLGDRESRAQVEAATALRRILVGLAERPPRPTRLPAEVHSSIRAGLGWLARHQDDDGRFDADGFMRHDPEGDRCDGPGEKDYDTGVTAFAVLALARSGATGRIGDGETEVDTALRRGIGHLGAVQDAEGCFGPRKVKHWIYGHAIGTLAVVEAYRVSRHPVWGRMAQRGLDFLAAARNPDGCWRYGVRPGDTDTSVNGWAVQALRAGERAGLRVDRSGYAAVLAYLDGATDRATGITGYQPHTKEVARMDSMKARFPPAQSRAMTASAVLQRFLLGAEPRGDELLRRGIERVLELPPVWDTTSGRLDLYSWLSGTEAMHHVGGETWRKWRGALRDAFLPSQHGPGSGARAGSWDPVDPWGTVGGRVYSTSAAVMCLEVHSGYLPPLPAREVALEGRGLRISRALDAAAKDPENHESVRAAAAQ